MWTKQKPRDLTRIEFVPFQSNKCNINELQRHRSAGSIATNEVKINRELNCAKRRGAKLSIVASIRKESHIKKECLNLSGQR